MNQFPDVHQATLNETTLHQLCEDIAAFGRDIEVIPKRQARQYASESSMSLAEAFVALREDAIRALQIRYSFEQQRWCDTLQRSVRGWELTRINLSAAMSNE